MFEYGTTKSLLTWWRHQMKTIPRYWPFVRGIHRWPMDSPYIGQWRGALMSSLFCAWKKRLSKQRRRLFETPSHWLWHHCLTNTTINYTSQLITLTSYSYGMRYMIWRHSYLIEKIPITEMFCTYMVPRPPLTVSYLLWSSCKQVCLTETIYNGPKWA